MDVNLSTRFDIGNMVYIVYEDNYEDDYYKYTWFVTKDKCKIVNIRYDFYYKTYEYFVKSGWVKEEDLFKEYNLALNERNYRMNVKI